MQRSLCGFTAVESNHSAIWVLLKSVLCYSESKVKAKPNFQAVPCTGKVGSDTLKGPRFVAKQGSYKVLHPGSGAEQQIASKRLCTRGHQRLAACTNSPLAEEEAVQSANLCFQCKKLQWLTLFTTYLATACGKKIARVRPSPCPLT